MSCLLKHSRRENDSLGDHDSTFIHPTFVNNSVNLGKSLVYHPANAALQANTEAYYNTHADRQGLLAG